MKFFTYKSLLSYVPSFALMVLGLVAIGFVQLKPPQSGTVIVIFDANVNEAEIVTALYDQNAFLMTKGPLSNSYVIRSDEKGLPKQLNDMGAWLVLNYLGAAGCTSLSQTSPNFPSRRFNPLDNHDLS